MVEDFKAGAGSLVVAEGVCCIGGEGKRPWEER